MLYVVFPLGIVIGSGFMFVAVTDYKGALTKNFSSKRPLSLGLKAISGTVRQLRAWYFVVGALGCVISVLGLIALLRRA